MACLRTHAQEIWWGSGGIISSECCCCQPSCSSCWVWGSEGKMWGAGLYPGPQTLQLPPWNTTSERRCRQTLLGQGGHFFLFRDLCVARALCWWEEYLEAPQVCIPLAPASFCSSWLQCLFPVAPNSIWPELTHSTTSQSYPNVTHFSLPDPPSQMHRGLSSPSPADWLLGTPARHLSDFPSDSEVLSLKGLGLPHNLLFPS